MTCSADRPTGRRPTMLSREGAEAVRQAVDAGEEPDMLDPEPLIAADEEPRPYPLDALSPTIRAAVTAYQEFGQQPINVGRDKNLIGPISLNLGVIAESGE